MFILYGSDMLRKYLLPFVAVFGAIIGLMVVFWSGKKEPVAEVPFPPPVSPYSNAIFGEGIVESSSENISIGSPFSEVITDIYVIEGDSVKKGDPLFKLDTRLYEAQAETARRQIELAFANLENYENQFSFYERLKDSKAVSELQYEQSLYALIQAEEQLKVADAQLGEIEANIERSTICAPIDGEILQVNVHVGEIAPVIPPLSFQLITPYSTTTYPLMLMGSKAPFNLRIDIDEEDSWRYQAGVAATAFVRGNSHLNFKLRFLRIEPYIIPKASFTGQTTERLDTRVLQVMYRFEEASAPVYGGQILDVYLEAEKAVHP